MFVVTIVPGRRCGATRSRRRFLISRFSATTSMIQPASAQRARSSSKFPSVIRANAAGPKNAAGRDLTAASNPARTMRLRTRESARVSPRAFSSGVSAVGTMSSRVQATPQLAKCAAMRAPMVPAPRTTTLSMRGFICAGLVGSLRARLSEASDKLAVPIWNSRWPPARRDKVTEATGKGQIKVGEDSLGRGSLKHGRCATSRTWLAQG